LLPTAVAAVDVATAADDDADDDDDDEGDGEAKKIKKKKHNERHNADGDGLLTLVVPKLGIHHVPLDNSNEKIAAPPPSIPRTPRYAKMLPSEAFELLRGSEKGMQLLKKFMKQEMSTENLDFILAAERYEKAYDRCVEESGGGSGEMSMKSNMQMSGRAYHLYETYIAADSSSEVNIPHVMKKRILAALDDIHIKREIFHEALKEVTKLVRGDTLVRLMKTPQFKKFTENSIEDFQSEVYYFGYVVGAPTRCGLVPRHLVRDVRLSSDDLPIAIHDGTTSITSAAGALSRTTMWSLKSFSKLGGGGGSETRRYVSSVFNLDLSFITPRIIAMGYPTDYTNPIADYCMFFNKKFKHRYCIYNLSGKRYRDTKFHGSVCNHPIKEKDVCPFRRIKPLCDSMVSWLDKDEKNVLAIHGKNGRGRTGMIVSCLICQLNKWFTANRAMRYFAAQRSKNMSGVTTPSQRLYVCYYERYLSDADSIPDSRPLKFHSLFMSPVPHGVTDREVFFTLTLLDDSRQKGGAATTPRELDSRECRSTCERCEDFLCITLFSQNVDHDVRVDVFSKGMFKSRLYSFCFNTRFLPEAGKDGFVVLQLSKKDIDLACKDTKHRQFDSDFHVRVKLKELITSTS